MEHGLGAHRYLPGVRFQPIHAAHPNLPGHVNELPYVGLGAYLRCNFVDLWRGSPMCT